MLQRVLLVGWKPSTLTSVFAESERQFRVSGDLTQTAVP
jgi:hypothetical protein